MAETAEEQRFSFRANMKERISYLSIHGLSKVALSSTRRRKFIWMLLFLTALSLLIIQVFNRVQQFFNYPVVTKFDRVSLSTLTVPSLTLCSNNHVKLGKLVDSFKANRASKDQRLLFRQAYNGYNRHVIQPLGDTWDELVASCRLPTKDARGGRARATCRRRYRSHANAYGNCFTFNPGWKNVTSSPYTDVAQNVSASVLKLPAIDAQVGVDFDIYLDYKNYTSSAFLPKEVAVSPGVYAMVRVHPPGTMPLPENMLLVRAGEHVVFTTRSAAMERQPGAGCIDYASLRRSSQLKHYDAFADVYGTDYGVETCKQTCEQRRAMKTCGCLLDGVPVTAEYVRSVTGNATVKYCGRHKQDECMKRIDATDDVTNLEGAAAAAASQRDDCSCPPPCSEHMYFVNQRSSGGVLASDDDVTTIWLHWLKSNAALRAGTTWSDWHHKDDEYAEPLGFVFGPYNELDTVSVGQLRHRLESLSHVTINVRLGDPFVEVKREHYGYSSVDLCADIGGLIGLYLGMSLLAVCEAFELLYDFLQFTCMKIESKMATDAGGKVA